ncbi:MAG TPA: alkaline shock response membrane anchor protein AmaP [Actinophytocola sp.]|nr:alkaline shock response membrane anchor protein AmaP [Actinophytocola sp.]
MNRPARLNRTLLATLGVLLLLAGAYPVAVYYDLLAPPWPTLVPGTAPPPTWVYWVTTAVAVVVALLALRWLFAQLAHRPKTHTWRLEHDPDHGRTELAPSTATAPFTAELLTYPGVHNAHTTLAGDPDHPALALAVTVEQDADLADLRTHLADHGLPRLRQALDLTDLPVTIEFRFTSTTGARVR